MGAIERRFASLGVPTNAMFEFILLRDWGIKLHPDTPGHLKKGINTTNGRVIIERMRCKLSLKGDGYQNEQNFFEKIVDAGLKIRRHQNTRKLRYQSNGFTEAIAGKLRARPQTVRKLIRSMRACWVTEELLTPHNQINPLTVMFQDTAEGLFGAYTGSDKLSKKLKELSRNWDGTIAGIYKGVYNKFSERSTGCLFPSEVDFLARYLSYTEKIGQLSFYSARILTAFWQHGTVQGDISELRTVSGVPVNSDALTIHKNVLVHRKVS